ncbi:hypothetical protein BLOT_008131 [Blomia tropicalis]|nr:hypothetical protein BLOT_008131 [Blomia tropicalis]
MSLSTATVLQSTYRSREWFTTLNSVRTKVWWTIVVNNLASLPIVLGDPYGPYGSKQENCYPFALVNDQHFVIK